MPSQVDQLKAKAEACRAFAATVKDEAIRSQLLGIAERYDRLAEQNDNWDKPSGRPGKTTPPR